jgi:hypothetical protein
MQLKTEVLKKTQKPSTVEITGFSLHLTDGNDVFLNAVAIYIKINAICLFNISVICYINYMK